MPVTIKTNWEIGLLFDAYDDQMAMETIAAVCEGAVLANMVWMGYMGLEQTPCCLSDAGVVYINPPGCAASGPCQKILGAAAILRHQKATCIDICCYVVARLRMQGYEADVVVINMLDKRGRPIEGQYHVLVETVNGVHDYTEDLIHGDLARCLADCG